MCVVLLSCSLHPSLLLLVVAVCLFTIIAVIIEVSVCECIDEFYLCLIFCLTIALLWFLFQFFLFSSPVCIYIYIYFLVEELLIGFQDVALLPS